MQLCESVCTGVCVYSTGGVLFGVQQFGVDAVMSSAVRLRPYHNSIPSRPCRLTSLCGGHNGRQQDLG
jgi:hypothetical protein